MGLKDETLEQVRYREFLWERLSDLGLERLKPFVQNPYSDVRFDMGEIRDMMEGMHTELDELYLHFLKYKGICDK